MSSEAGEGASTSTSPTKEQMDTQAKAVNLLAQGKRNLICNEVTTAVQQFQDACEMLVEQFGDMAKECAEAYFLYGGALLDLARMEQGVLGNALEGVDMDAEDEGGPSNEEQFEPTEKIDDEQRMELRMQVVEAMSEDEISNRVWLATGKKPEMGKTSFGGAISKYRDEDRSKPEDLETESYEKEGRQRQSSIEKKVAGINIDEGDDVDETGWTKGPDGKEVMEDSDSDKTQEEMEGTEDDEEEGEDGEGAEAGASPEDGEEDPDDIPNLQLSWEMLEMAKLVYSKDPSRESQLRLAETYLKLGEVGLESEHYDQAIGDFESCLSVQKQHLDSFDRGIAETYYQLGLACQFGKQLEKAKDSFTSAVTCLEMKMEKLKTVVQEKPPKGPSDFVEPAEKAQREIEEILAILPEIKEKIVDTDEEIKSMETIKLMAKRAMGSVFSAAASSEGDSVTVTGFPGTSSSPVKSSEPSKTMDISHLVRKKRKQEVKEVDEDLNKKQKQEGSGDAAVNGVCEQVDSPSSTVTT